MTCISEDSFRILVKPSAKKNEIFGFDDARKAYRIAIKEPAEDGRANLEMVKFLSKELGRKVHIVSGHRSKVKMIRAL
jgi:uncharacterized protein (TIGR00251 family)